MYFSLKSRWIAVTGLMQLKSRMQRVAPALLARILDVKIPMRQLTFPGPAAAKQQLDNMLHELWVQFFTFVCFFFRYCSLLCYFLLFC